MHIKALENTSAIWKLAADTICHRDLHVSSSVCSTRASLKENYWKYFWERIRGIDY